MISFSSVPIILIFDGFKKSIKLSTNISGVEAPEVIPILENFSILYSEISEGEFASKASTP